MAIVIAGYYGFNNTGDELILYALIQKYRQAQPDSAITVLSQNPTQTRAAWGVASVNRWQPWKWVLPFLRSDTFILGGGGLLQETTSLRNHLYYLTIVLFAKLLGCRTILYAQGIDAMKSPMNRFWTRFVLNHWVDELSVRDEASQTQLRTIGVTLPMSILLDPVCTLPMGAHDTTSRKLAFIFSDGFGRTNSASELAAFCDQVARQLQTSADLIVFYPEKDEALAREVASHASRIDGVRVLQNPLDALEWMGEYGLVFSSRFHALVLAGNAQIPFVGLGAQAKIIRYCESKAMFHMQTVSERDWNKIYDRISELYQASEKSVILANRTN